MNIRRRLAPLGPYAYLAPAIAVLGLFFVGSFVQVLYYSFTDYNAFGPPVFIGLDNYASLLSDARFWTCVGNSFLYLLVTPVLIVISMCCAMLIDSGIRGSRAMRLLFFLPVVTPTIVAAIAWRVLYNEDTGLLNAAITLVGLEPIGWLTERPWTLVSAMLVTLWKGFGFYMMIFLAGLLAVPGELKEAAALDGAGRFGVVRHVVLPAVWPVVTLVLIISSIAALKVFDELYVTVKGVPIDHQTAVPLVYQSAFIENAFGMASAIGVVLFVIIFVFSLINLRLTGGLGEGGAAR